MISTPDQPALLEVEDDLSLPVERVRHAFTGEQLERREQLREAITLLLAAGVPVATIATRVGVSNHTVMLLRDRLFESVAEQKKDFAQVCLSKGAKFLGLAEAVVESASYKDRMIGFGIATQRGMELLAMGSGVELSESKAVDVEAARLRIERLLADAPAVLDVSAVDPVSVDRERVSEGFCDCDVRCDAYQPPGRIQPADGRTAQAAGAGQGAGGVGESTGAPDDDVSPLTEVIGKGGS